MIDTTGRDDSDDTNAETRDVGESRRVRTVPRDRPGYVPATVIVKPHGRDCPDRCSMCRTDAVPRKVTMDGAIVLVDGEPVNSADDERARYYSRRGGKAHHDGRRPKP